MTLQHAFAFTEWCAKYYIRLTDVWVHRYDSQTDKSKWKTTEELYSIYQTQKQGI